MTGAYRKMPGQTGHRRRVAPAAPLLAALWLTVTGGAASAQVLCDCCGDAAALAKACEKPCAEMRAEPLCRPLILPRGTADGARRGDNPLAGTNLKYLDLRDLSPRELERVRRWAERWRAQAERRYARSLRLRRRHRITVRRLHEVQGWRDGVVVNYQHVIRAYREALRHHRRASR